MNGIGSAMRTRRAAAWTRRVATLAGFSLLPGLLTSVAFADHADPLGKPQVTLRSDKVSPFTAKANKTIAAVVEKSAAEGRSAVARAKGDRARTVSWPTAGRARLVLPATGPAAASPGSLPLTLDRPRQAEGKKYPRAAGSVEVTVLDQKRTAELGVKGIVLSVTGPVGGGNARLGISYDSFVSAYGGDWAGRLQALRLPNCALSDPAKAVCRTRTPLEFTNDRKHNRIDAQLAFGTATASAPAARAEELTWVVALAATTKSGGGDYKATPLAASSTWEAGGSAGTFTWSYPLRTPPAAAGPAPELSISYDSGAVDGQTANTNNQGTAIGTGFDITSSYVERKYGVCDDDGQAGKFDLCWKYDNASLVLNGRSSELVKDDTTGVWRLKNDDASTVTHSTGADNGDDNGEYWTVTTGDGTRYVFGLDKLAGAAADDRTDSVWTVPVFGDDSGEPGYADGTGFSSRSKKQAWRWNLDYVEDTHRNAMSYWYTAESNNYDQLGDDNTGTSYVRGGYLKEIRYGQRADGLFATQPASNKVGFSYAERCDATGTGCDTLTENTRDNWPDVPFDSVCKDGAKCTGSVSPTFFTRKRLTGVTTYAWDSKAATPGFFAVDSWALKQHYIDPGDTGDSTDQSLWLDEIRHTGKRGSELSLDPVTFTSETRPNRVDSTSDDILSLEKPRLKTVTSEAGAQTVVTYMDAGCVAGQTMPRPDQNTGRCYPVYWSPNGEKTPILDWFQKYPVTSVLTTDPHGGSEAVQNTYTYADGGAWHYNDDPMTKEKDRTWSIWRGFGRVTHLTGVPGKTQSKTVTVYMRGMNGDRVLKDDGKTLDPDKRRTAKVTGIKAAEITDSEPYAGFTRETVTYNGANEVGGTITDPWSKKTATQHKSYADTEAYYVRTGATHTRTNITSSGTPKDLVRSSVTTFDDYGMPETVEDKGDDAVPGDEKCTRTWYARNDSLGINSLASRTRIVTKPCSTTDSALDLPADSTRAGDVVTDIATAYDTTTWSATQKPTKGEVQWTGRAKSYGADGAPSFQKRITTTYDILGRPLTVKDTNDALVTTTSYEPSGRIGPLRASTSTNIKGHTTTTTVDFATGAATMISDPNGKITESEYDSLGRVVKVWLPNRLRVLNATPNYVYDYSIKASSAPWVSTGSLKGDASGYNTTYAIYDSLLRPRQTQTPSPQGGTVVSETLYDERGQAVTSLADIWADKIAPSGKLVATEGGQAPMENDTTYDGAGRATVAVTKVRGVERFRTRTDYTGDTVSNSAPAGGQATMVTTNALGQTTERREYAGPQATGSDYTSTRYKYTPAGQQMSVSGPGSALWSYTYDLFGRESSSTDPDKGTSHTQYNALDQVISTTDSRNRTLVSGYDELGRRTGLWDGTKSDATLLASWGFDSVAKGQQDTATRYENGLTGKAYTTKVTAYDNLYQVTRSQLLLPESDPLVTAGVPKALSFTTGYNADGTVKQASQPAVAGLPSETVSSKYNALGQQTAATGSTGYLLGAAYSPQGDLRQLTLGTDPTSSAKRAYLNYDYEDGTRRLSRSYVTDDVHGYMPQELKYTQDDAGNVTSIFDASTQGGTSKADYQCFEYDGNRRLAEAWTPKTADCAKSGRSTANLDGAAPYWTSYTYKESGQRETETQHTASGNTTTSYTYGTATGQPHPLAKTTGTKTSTYAYDAAGNTTSRPGTQSQQTLVWNSEGKLVSSSEPAAGDKPKLETTYLYDASGELLIRRATGDGDTVLYLGSTEVRLTAKGTTKTLSGTRYYTAAGKTIALRTATTGVAGTKLNFLCADPHGTATLVLEPTTWAVTKRYTTPFGSTRGTPSVQWPDDKGFLGKPADVATGLTHVGAREYDPGIGQFISVDPVLALDQHQSLNGYSYANNTPVTASDPTGLACYGGNHSASCNPTGQGGGIAGSDNCYGGNHSASCNPTGQGGAVPGAAPGGSRGTTTTISGGGGGGGRHCGVWSKCGWSNAWEGTKDWMQDHKTTIAVMATEVVTGGACYGASLLGAPATGGASLTVTAGCGAIAGAAGAAVGNAMSEDADHSTAGKASDMIDGAVWGAATAVVTSAIAGKMIGKMIGCHSFLPGTKVLLADGSHKAIEDVEAGDVVSTTDTSTGKDVDKKVVDTITTEDDKAFTEVTIIDADHVSSIVATDTHPFWVPELRKWVKAGELQVGQWLRTSAGTHVQITALGHYTKRQRTHDLTIQDVHAYYVLAGATPVLVHNCNKNQGVYIFDDVSKPGHVYIGKTNNFNVRLNKHADLGRRDKSGPVICIHVCGDDSTLRIREHIMKVQFEKMGFKLSSGIEGFGRNLYNKRQATQPELPFG
ncbi:RHS repeat-associated core domain-containing protein [Streptomyces sp. NBC_01423]|uniref:RHS repeat-associated core domain-containing protein n=1 Tax=Streptomyces sp. NBC_01423 TaxID=2903860 RepID=UPI002E29D8D4|nr:RHS repeat-associated core domain-containing protein [Streptomyces sp. NBC_01423]